jgi:hypothetical protein
LATADPLYNISILASTSQNGPYTSSLEVQPGQTYYYEVVGQVAPIGTVNGPRTITSQSAADGANSLSVNILANGSNPIQIGFNSSALALTSTIPSSVADWNGAPGFSAGTIADNGGGMHNAINLARPIHAAGVVSGGLSPDVILFGSFTVDSAPLGPGLLSLVTPSFGGVASTFKYNSAANTAFVSSSTENGATPYLGFAPLTLTTANVPEPSSFILGGIGVIALWVIRRRKA